MWHKVYYLHQGGYVFGSICLHAMLSVNIIAQQVLSESVKWCRVNKSRVFKANWMIYGQKNDQKAL